MMHPGKCVLKRAVTSDVDLLFRWINDPAVREQSFSQEMVSYEKHVSWFTGKLADPRCFLYIALVQDIPIGMIRFDRNNDRALISYLVSPESRGRGLGGIILSSGVEQFLKDSGFVGTIEAMVKISNPASIRIFEKNAFKLRTVQDQVMYFEKAYL